MKYFILGSCVSRDIFRILDKDTVVDYYSRTTLKSLMSSPVAIDEIKLESNFQKRMVKRDFEKSLFHDLENANFDYLIIDLIDERFDIVKVNDSCVTRSNEFINAGLDNIGEKATNISEDWDKYCKQFSMKLLSIVPLEKIVIHEAYWANYYVENGENKEFLNQDKINYNNKVLKEKYKILREYIPARAISVQKRVADPKHLWGLTPFHYTNDYYMDIYKQLSSQMTEKDKNIIGNYISNEKEYKGKVKVKYIFEKARKSNSDKLIISFSAFSPQGEPPKYTFMRTLKDFNCNKLFILDDFTERGTYYLSIDREDSIEQSVSSLINNILKEEKISKDNVITIGSSKGGFSALYYAIKYGFGHSIVGSPPLFIGNSLTHSKQFNVLEPLLNFRSKEELNNILVNEINNSKKFPNININVGKREYHYFEHVKHLIDKLNERNVKFNVEFNDFEKHSDLSKFFPNYLTNTVKKILGMSFIKEMSIDKALDGGYLVNVDAHGEDLSYAWYVLRDEKVIKKHWYTKSNEFKWIPEEKGEYRIAVFVRDKNLHTVSKTSDKLVFNN